MHLQENEVVSVSGDGRTVNLLHPLRYTHHGVTEMYEGGHFIDIRWGCMAMQYVYTHTYT